MVVFSVCKDLYTSFSNDMQGMFLYVQKRQENLCISVYLSEVLHLSGLPVPVCRGIRLPILCCAFFLFSGTKVAPHAAFVKGRFTLRVKNLLCSLRSCGIFYPSPLTNTLCFAGRCLGKKKKMLFFGVFCLFLYS